jgi:predicted transposase/invertase (TIGR01784 family)
MIEPAMQPNVHDAFFKEMLSRPEHAASLLQQILPASIAARIHFDSLAPCAGSYVDEALKERHSDLLFSVPLEGRPALVYLLFEHQSTVDALMSFRLLRYEVRIWERWLRDNPGARKLPVILPVVLHHSVDGWTGTVAFEDLLDVDQATLADVAPYVPHFQFLLEDISHETDEALRARAITALARLSLWCLRHAREPWELVDRLGAWLDLVREVRGAPHGVAALVRIMRYIFATNEPDQPEALVRRLLAAVGEEGKEEIMTAADQLIERGREQGLKQGLEQGRREVLLDLLRERFGALPDAAAVRVTAAGMTELQAWSKRVLRASTLDDVFAGS